MARDARDPRSAGRSTQRVTVAKDADPEREAAIEALTEAARAWRAAKKAERQARDDLAGLVRDVVSSGRLSENKVAGSTKIPRMTIRKMLGKAGA